MGQAIRFLFRNVPVIFGFFVLTNHLGAQTSPPAQGKVPEKQVVAGQENFQQQPFRKKIEREGIAVEVAIDHVDPVNKVPGFFKEGDLVKVGFSINDTATGAPVRNAYPAGWLDLVPPGEVRDEASCTGKLKAFIGGSLITAPEIDLNQYYVVSLNKDATLTVVDPVFGFGGTKLLAMVALDSPGGDWAKLDDQSRIFVSMPDSNKIAVVETATWRLSERLETGPRPIRTMLQPDEHYLWSAYRGTATEPGGVVVFRTGDLKEAARFETGSGAHDLVFDKEGRFAFVSNRDSATVTVIDVRKLTKVTDIAVGKQPVSMDYSHLAQAVYVSSRSGKITIIDATAPQAVATIESDPGLGPLRFAPGGRYAFVLSPKEKMVHVIDATRQRIIQSGGVLAEPDQITFTNNIGYIRHAGSEIILMVALAEIGQEGKPVGVIDFPGGQLPPGQAMGFTPADGIVQAPGADAVLVANGPDEAIYYYREGMAAPMGQFANYSHAPRAVMVVDRSLQEHTRPGFYESFVRLEKAGIYDLVFFLDSPRIAHCFGLSVASDPKLQAKRDSKQRGAKLSVAKKVVEVGKPVSMDVSIVDHRGKLLDNLNDVMVLVNLQPGVWHHRYSAEHAGGGIYKLTFTPPRPGVYYIYASSKTAGLSYGNNDYLVIRAIAPKNATRAGNGK